MLGGGGAWRPPAVRRDPPVGGSCGCGRKLRLDEPGSVLLGEPFREDHRFTGKEEDVEVGLAYFGFRYLSAALGRWVSADPLPIHQVPKGDQNAYAYVRGRLLQATDPFGLNGEAAKVIVAATAAAESSGVFPAGTAAALEAAEVTVPVAASNPPLGVIILAGGAVFLVTFGGTTFLLYKLDQSRPAGVQVYNGKAADKILGVTPGPQIMGAALPAKKEKKEKSSCDNVTPPPTQSKTAAPTGTWVLIPRRMTLDAAAFESTKAEKSMTPLPGKSGNMWCSWEVSVGGVTFDGVDSGGYLIEAKASYQQLKFSTKSGWSPYDQALEKMGDQVERQRAALDAAGNSGMKIRWYFKEQETAQDARAEFNKRQVKNIEVIGPKGVVK